MAVVWWMNSQNRIGFTFLGNMSWRWLPLVVQQFCGWIRLRKKQLVLEKFHQHWHFQAQNGQNVWIILGSGCPNADPLMNFHSRPNKVTRSGNLSQNLPNPDSSGTRKGFLNEVSTSVNSPGTVSFRITNFSKFPENARLIGSCRKYKMEVKSCFVVACNSSCKMRD